MAIQAQLYHENLEFPFGGYQENVLSQDWMGNACGLNELYLFDPQQQKQQYQQQQQQQQQQQRNQDLCLENGFLTTKYNGHNINQSMTMNSQRLATLMQKENQEMDRFIVLQNERLKLALQEQRKQQLMTILKTYELKSQFLLRQKDEEIAKISNRTKELEAFLGRTEMERQTWEKIAKDSEIMAMELNIKLEQLKGNNVNGEAEDAESCCETEEKGNGKSEEKMVCKGCFGGESCVVFLPCRHLCSCKSCDALLETCPVCGMLKKASIEVLI